MGTISHIRILGLLILLFGVCFYSPFVINHINSIWFDPRLIKETTFWIHLFLLFFYLFCGYGLMRINKLARFFWLIYSGYIVLASLLTIQSIFHGGFFKFEEIPLFYWLKFFTLFFLSLISLIFFNFSGIKLIFTAKAQREGIKGISGRFM